MENLEKILIEDYDKKFLKALKEFLKMQNLSLEEDLDYRMAFLKEEKIIGSGCFKKNILKCIALDDNYKGQGISNLILSDLINEEYRIGNNNIFIFTKPKNLNIFKNYGFYEIIDFKDKIVFLENHEDGFKNYFKKFYRQNLSNNLSYGIFLSSLESLYKLKGEILNIKRECDYLHVFVFSQKGESIDFKEKNLVIHKDFNYLIPYKLFSKYFLNEKDINKYHSLISVKIVNCIIKNLKISKSFVLENEIFKVLINEETKEFLKDNNLNLEKY